MSLPESVKGEEAMGEFTQEERNRAYKQVQLLMGYRYIVLAAAHDMAIALQCSLNRANAAISEARKLLDQVSACVRRGETIIATPEIDEWLSKHAEPAK